MSKKKLEALFNAVIVKPIKVEETTYGNIIVPDIDKQTNETGEVIAVGPGIYSATGTFIPTVTKVGDIVLLPAMSFTRFSFEDVELYVGRENDLISKIIEIEE